MSFYDWITDSNNPKLDKSEYLYNTRHLICLGIVLCLCVVLSLLFYKRSSKVKWVLLRIGGGVLLFFEIASRVVNLIIADSYTFESVAKIILPMHICSVMVWIFIIAVFSKNETLINFAAIGGLLATLAFLLYPAVGLNKTYMSFTCIYSTVSHMIGFVMAILLMTLGLTKFDFKHIWKVYLCFAIMFLWGMLLDFVIFKGSDYMYLVNDPLELNMAVPYQLVYGLILVVYIAIFYFVSFLIKKSKRKR